jgi:hypothetical protein
MVPPNAGGKAMDFTDTVVGMLQSLRHGHPLVNGYSGFVPPMTQHVLSELRRFPNPQAVPHLQDAGVRYVVVDKAWPAAASMLDPTGFGFVRVFSRGRRDVYAVPSVHDDIGERAEQRQ